LTVNPREEESNAPKNSPTRPGQVNRGIFVTSDSKLKVKRDEGGIPSLEGRGGWPDWCLDIK
jgi:hypothetical protein